MTKDAVENVIKRYAQITYALERDLRYAIFYVGKRREVIEITDEIKKVCEIIKNVLNKEKDFFIRQMIKDIIAGKTDIYIMQNMPYSKNAYYTRKQGFIEKVYDCCIARRLVSYEDVLNEEIAI